MGFLRDELPPNVYVIGDPGNFDGWSKVRAGIQSVTAVDRISQGNVVGGVITLGTAAVRPAVGAYLQNLSPWAYIDLNDYTIGINGVPPRPIAEISFAAITGEGHGLVLGFDSQTVFGVSSTGPRALPAAFKALIRYILQFTSLPDVNYPIDPAVPDLQNISRAHAQAYADYYFA